MIVPLLALLATGWLVLLVAAPILPVPIAGALYALGSHICHQRPDRSFHLLGAQLPVCARCAGIYAGAALGASAAALGARFREFATQSSARAILFLGAVPTGLTLALEWTGLWTGSNAVRAAAGLPLGVASAFVVVQAAATLHYGGCAPRRPIATASATYTYLICAAAWAIPGAGHLLLGRLQKGLTFLITLTLMFVFGLWLEGRSFPDRVQPAAGGARGARRPRHRHSVLHRAGDGLGRACGGIDLRCGNAFLIVAGLMNMLVVLDAFDIAQGRK